MGQKKTAGAVLFVIHKLCLLEVVCYFPMQKAEVIDNKNFTDLRLKYGPNI